MGAGGHGGHRSHAGGPVEARQGVGVRTVGDAQDGHLGVGEAFQGALDDAPTASSLEVALVQVEDGRSSGPATHLELGDHGGVRGAQAAIAGGQVPEPEEVLLGRVLEHRGL